MAREKGERGDRERQPRDREESELRRNTETQGKGARQYESGRNPDMQAQQSNRQGDGNPTQQGRNDR